MARARIEQARADDEAVARLRGMRRAKAAEEQRSELVLQHTLSGPPAVRSEGAPSVPPLPVQPSPPPAIPTMSRPISPSQAQPSATASVMVGPRPRPASARATKSAYALQSAWHHKRPASARKASDEAAQAAASTARPPPAARLRSSSAANGCIVSIRRSSAPSVPVGAAGSGQSAARVKSASRATHGPSTAPQPASSIASAWLASAWKLPLGAEQTVALASSGPITSESVEAAALAAVRAATRTRTE
jgi:hypothetical protein